jgi:hypothetical protein
MAAPAIGRRRFWLPPTSTFRIDWSHPAASGLRAFITPERVYGSGYINSTVVAATVPTVYGRAMDISGATLQAYFDPVTTGSSGITVAAIAQRDSGEVHIATGDSDGGITSNWPSSQGRCWQLRFNIVANTIQSFTFTAAGSVVNYVTSGASFPAGTPTVAAMSMTADKTFQAVARTPTAAVSWSGASTGSTGWSITSLGRLGIGRAGSATGWFLCAWVWHRALGLDELQALTADPFAMLRY